MLHACDQMETIQLYVSLWNPYSDKVMSNHRDYSAVWTNYWSQAGFSVQLERVLNFKHGATLKMPNPYCLLQKEKPTVQEFKRPAPPRNTEESSEGQTQNTEVQEVEDAQDNRDNPEDDLPSSQMDAE